MTTYANVEGNQSFTLKMEAACPPNRWYPITSVHGVLTGKTATWICIALKTSSLTYLHENWYERHDTEGESMCVL